VKAVPSPRAVDPREEKVQESIGWARGVTLDRSRTSSPRDKRPGGGQLPVRGKPRTPRTASGDVRRAAGTDEVSRLVSRRKLWRTESHGCQWGEINPRGSRRSKPSGGCENLQTERTG